MWYDRGEPREPLGGKERADALDDGKDDELDDDELDDEDLDDDEIDDDLIDLDDEYDDFDEEKDKPHPGHHRYDD